MSNPSDPSYFRLLCDHLGVALIATDENLVIQYWNAAATRTFGATSSAMLGSPAVSLFPHTSRPRALELCSLAINTGETGQFECTAPDQAGADRELVVTIAPVVASKGDRLGASLCVRDITQRIRLQQELYDSRKMASLGQMAGAVAHHFNNILGGAITGMDYAAGADEYRVQRQVIQQIERALVRAMHLVKDLLVFAEGDAAYDEREDVSTLLQEVHSDLVARVKDLPIQIELSMDPQMIGRVPKRRVGSILHTIASNAIEAMPDGGTLSLRVIRHGDHVDVAISDTGPGIDDETLPRVFEPFWTTKGGLGAGSTRPSGLGLAIALGIARTIGATINAESKPGVGTCFTVCVPLEAVGGSA